MDIIIKLKNKIKDIKKKETIDIVAHQKEKYYHKDFTEKEIVSAFTNMRNHHGWKILVSMMEEDIVNLNTDILNNVINGKVIEDELDREHTRARLIAIKYVIEFSNKYIDYYYDNLNNTQETPTEKYLN